MRAILTASLAAAVIGLGAATLLAAPASVAVQLNATPVIRLAQGEYYGGEYYGAYRPACPERYYYACWSDPYGRGRCGCLPGFDYYLFRFY